MADSTRGVVVRLSGRLIVAALAAGLAVGLTACGGGGDVGIGDGQGADPVVLDIPVVYVRRPLPADDQGQPVTHDARRPIDTFNPGADLWFRERASVTAADRNLTGAMTQGLYDIRDLETSFDGERVIFAMRGPFDEGAEMEDQPKWGIWEYEIATSALRQITTGDGPDAGHDIAPHYLPDGRIVFSSTRQYESAGILNEEGKPQYSGQDEDRQEHAFVLHVMDSDGGNLHQISYNQSHDLDPTVLSSGEIVFTRWDNVGSSASEMNLYRANPDGSNLQLLYGAQSHVTGATTPDVQFLQVRELPNGQLLTAVRGFTSDNLATRLLAIDTGNYVNSTQGVPASAGLGGPAEMRVTANDVVLGNAPSPQGLYSSAFPLHDGTNRILVSWSQCRVIENGSPQPCTPERLAAPGAVPAPPIYGLWIYDPRDNTQLPVVRPEEGVMYTDIVALEPRRLPLAIPDGENGVFDPALVAEGVGILKIRSVYDFLGNARSPLNVNGPAINIAALADPAQTTAANLRPARFLRLEKAVLLPDRDVRDFDGSAFGVGGAGQGMREILGYTMVEPDGSVMVKVPANVPVALSVLDAAGRRISNRHQNWLQVRPGEVKSCNGCHTANSTVAHGRDGAFASAWAGAAAAGSFPNSTTAILAEAPGETMAEARMRTSCFTDCVALLPSVDVRFDDVWTDPVAAARAADASFDYSYADLTTTVPTPPACQASWQPICRITIHYQQHIHPLWSVDRRVFDSMMTLIADNTCTTCHNEVDAATAAQVPAGQLDLSDGQSDRNGDFFMAYSELFSGDNEQEIVGGTLQDRVIQVQIGVDPITGDPIFENQFVGVSPSMSTAGARSSPRFFNRFLDAGFVAESVDHFAMLSGSELKLLAEWTDLGAQYYNDPFLAPTN